MKGKRNNSFSPWMVCLRLGSHGVVGGHRHFKTYEQADRVRQEMLNSPSVKAQPHGSVGVLVMHFKKFKQLCEAGEACTISRLRANTELFPNLAAVSLAANQLSDIDVSSIDLRYQS